MYLAEDLRSKETVVIKRMKVANDNNINLALAQCVQRCRRCLRFMAADQPRRRPPLLAAHAVARGVQE